MRHWFYVVAFASGLSCESSKTDSVSTSVVPPDVGPGPVDVGDLSDAADAPVDVHDTEPSDTTAAVDTVTVDTVTPDAGPPDTGPIYLPVLIGCGGQDKYTEAVCTPDGYCTIDDSGNPQVICCDEPCNGERGGVGQGAVPFYEWDWVKHPTLPDDAPCKEVGVRFRTWIYGLTKPRRQWAEMKLEDRNGIPCSAPVKNIVIECWPPEGEIESVMEESGDRLLVRCPLVAQGDGRIRQAYGRWLHPEYCGENGNAPVHEDDPGGGYCNFQYAWITPETAPWAPK